MSFGCRWRPALIMQTVEASQAQFHLSPLRIYSRHSLYYSILFKGGVLISGEVYTFLCSWESDIKTKASKGYNILCWGVLIEDQGRGSTILSCSSSDLPCPTDERHWTPKLTTWPMVSLPMVTWFSIRIFWYMAAERVILRPRYVYLPQASISTREAR